MIGTQIAHYRVHAKLGAGGMGVVYAADDVRLGRPVALKLLPDDCSSDDVERFRREARAASALNHPNICTVHDVGDVHGRPFIVMELLRGTTLASRLAAKPLRIDEVLDFAAQAASALDAAHAAGIVHRDVKPANLFITDGGHVKVLDFGIFKLAAPRVRGTAGGGAGDSPNGNPDAHTIGDTSRDLTGPGATMGTVGYMSPEHLLGDAIDHRADLFSLGVVMYEMATGVQPFKGATGAAVIDSILHHEPAPATTLRSELPQELQRIIAKGLEKDRALRYQSAADLRADLLRLKRQIESAPAARTPPPVASDTPRGLRLVQSWESVARDSREFAQGASGIMYWFRVPLGGICYPEGFRNVLQPALENTRISRLRFVLDTSEIIRQTWQEMVLPLIEDWAVRTSQFARTEPREDAGTVWLTDGRSLGWIFVELAQEFSPCFKLVVDDASSTQRTHPEAQIFLATSVRTVRLRSGAQRTIRIPDTILRVLPQADENLLLALARVAGQWDLMFE